MILYVLLAGWALFTLAMLRAFHFNRSLLGLALHICAAACLCFALALEFAR